MLDPDDTEEDSRTDLGIDTVVGITVDTITDTAIDGFGSVSFPRLGQPITAGTTSVAMMALAVFIFTGQGRGYTKKCWDQIQSCIL